MYTITVLFCRPALADSDGALLSEIPAQSLAQALAAYAHQTGLQIVYVSAVVRGKHSKGAAAGLAPDAALTRLLEGTALSFEFLNARSVRIFTAAPMSKSPTARPVNGGDVLSGPMTQEEVIVTAMRREERANDAPISMQVWSQQAIEAWGANDMADIAAMTAGIQFDHYPERLFQNNISMRGLNGGDGTTIGIYLDDVPLPNPSSWGGTMRLSFPLLFDLERVEVLRGPQGTLFGEGAEGGAVRFISRQPDLTQYSGLAAAQVADIARGATSYELGAAVGGPIAPGTAGFRLAGWRRTDGGFVDRVDPFTGATVEADADRSFDELFRGALLLAPGDLVQIVPSLTYQSEHRHDTSSFYTYLSDPAAGLLRNGKLLRQPGEDEFALASLRLTANLATSDLTAIIGYFHRTASFIEDFTNIPIWDNPMGPEYPLTYSDAISTLHELSESRLSAELRIASAIPDSQLMWLAGAFYAEERHHEIDTTTAMDSAVGSMIDGYNAIAGDQTELAAFGHLALRVSRTVSIEAGARIARYEYQANTTTTGPQYAGFPTQYYASGQDGSLAPRVGLEYRPGEDQLVYASAAKGYRMGGVNGPNAVYCGVSPAPAYHPDSLWSFELGGKNRLLSGHLQLDTSLFYVTWRDVQLGLIYPDDNLCSLTGNAGSATSRGFELQATAIVSSHLSTELAIAYEDARYTETVHAGSALIVARGDVIGTLPLVPAPWNLRTSVDYQQPLRGRVTGYARADWQVQSHNPGPFYSWHPDDAYYAPTRTSNPATNLLNIRSGLRWSHVDVCLLVSNLLDSQPTLLRRNNSIHDTLFYATTFQPRTIGVSGTVSF